MEFDTTNAVNFPVAPNDTIFSFRYNGTTYPVTYSSPNVNVFSGQVNCAGGPATVTLGNAAYPTGDFGVGYGGVGMLVMSGGSVEVQSNVQLALAAGSVDVNSGGLFRVDAGGALAASTPAPFTVNGQLDMEPGALANFTVANSDLGSATPMLSATTLNIAGSTNLGVNISTSGALPTGRYALIGYGSTPGVSSPAANFQLVGTAPPSGQNWGPVNRGNHVDLVVAGTAAVQNATAWSSTDPNIFGATPAWLVNSGGSFAALQSAATAVDGASPGTGGALLTGPGGAPLAATILAGINSGDFTGGTAGVTMAWRARTPQEVSSARLVSNVVQILGMSRSTAEPSQTDPFALQMAYDPNSVLGLPHLAWRNPNGGGPGVPAWENAVLGDTGNNATLVEQGFPGSFALFQTAVNDTNLHDYIGAWGFDPLNHNVWAVINHNSDFAVAEVPEPSTLALMALGLSALAIYRRRPTAGKNGRVAR